MPQYKKVFDIGTYTGNGGQYRVGIPTLRVPGPSGKQAAGSLRFRQENSAYLSRTQGTPTNAQKMTFSFWMKKTSVAGTRNILFTNDSGSGGAYGYFEIYSDNTFTCGDYGSGGYASTYKFRDNSKWYHIVVAFDTTQTAAVDRMIVYIDNKRDPGSYTGLTQNGNLNLATSGWTTQIGSFVRIGVYSGIYLSEFYRIDGQQLTPSSFAELNSDGIWVPKAYSGTYGTTGFYLPMNTSANYATDQSGNGNNFTPSVFNVTTSNTTYDIMTDSPTDYLSGSMTTANNAGNYATLNPIDSQCTLSNGNLRATGSTNSSYYFSRSTQSIPTTGSWYWEVTATTLGTYLDAGVMGTNRAFNSTYYVGYYSNELGFFNGSGTNETYQNGTNILSHSALNAGDVIMFAHSEGKTWIGVNGTWLNSGNPSAGTGYIGNILSESLSPAVSLRGASSPVVDMNFGQRTFAYTPPTGFKAINTYNYPRPADSALWFYGDTPDLMWIKNRSTTGLNVITDTVRGMGLNLVTSSTAAETSYPGVTEMNKFGMSIINDGTSILNGSTNGHVYWAWKAGSNTSSTSVTNTDGTITSQVSANRQAGFSVVTYTGDGSASKTVGHGLNAIPSMVIMRKRNVTSGWYVAHYSLNNSYNFAYHMFLNTSGAVSGNDDPYFLGSSNTPSVIEVLNYSGSNGGNQSGTNYVAYCFAAIPGYSAFGSYTGNGSADGPFVYLGFRPRWILLSRTDAAHQWYIHDTTRDTYNVAGSELYPNLTNAEAAATRLDFLSNGLKIRTTGTDHNASGGTYIYMAMAEIPFKFSRAR